jgi:hypothetical protein
MNQCSISTPKGSVFHRWTLLEDAPSLGSRVLCQCECGTKRRVIVGQIRSKRGRSKSCGCLGRELKTLTREQFLNRFWSHVDKKNDDECWNWTAGFGDGYGCMNGAKRHTGENKSHRISFVLDAGRPIKDGMMILHSCDNPACVNPHHLREGTHEDNMRDKAERERGKGKQGPRQFTEKHLKALRKSFKTRTNTFKGNEYQAKRYKVTHPNGKIEIITNLAKFCRENNLDLTTARNVARGRYKCKLGYKFEHQD